MQDTPTGWVHEVFASIQGEGLYCGQRQTFIRFAGCNLSCRYCDTPSALDPHPVCCRVESTPGGRTFDDLANPVTVPALVSACDRLCSKTISITGGEPLLQPEFLSVLAAALRENGLTIHLETNGILYDELRQVVEFVDVVAMDAKLESATGKPTPWQDHRRFMEVARQSEVFVKAVVSAETPPKEIEVCADLIAAVDPAIPLVVQPMTGGLPLEEALLMKLQDAALQSLRDVRVIPQCHKLLGLL